MCWTPWVWRSPRGLRTGPGPAHGRARAALRRLTHRRARGDPRPGVHAPRRVTAPGRGDRAAHRGVERLRPPGHPVAARRRRPPPAAAFPHRAAVRRGTRRRGSRGPERHRRAVRRTHRVRPRNGRDLTRPAAGGIPPARHRLPPRRPQRLGQRDVRAARRRRRRGPRRPHPPPGDVRGPGPRRVTLHVRLAEAVREGDAEGAERLTKEIAVGALHELDVLAP